MSHRPQSVRKGWALPSFFALWEKRCLGEEPRGPSQPLAAESIGGVITLHHFFQGSFPGQLLGARSCAGSQGQADGTGP